MRILAGAWANKTLTSPAGRVRPTAEDLREHIMRTIGRRIEGARFLDLFAGTGSVGLEAVSRGAASCDFVENGASALHALKANVALVRARDKLRVFTTDAIPFVERLEAGRYDVAFADPPYGSRKLDRIVAQWLDVPFAQLLLVEHAHDAAVPAGGRTRTYGESALTLYTAAR